MPWIAPKTALNPDLKFAWKLDDGIGTKDLNRIEGNAGILGQGNGHTIITTIASANALGINDLDETFFVSGNAEIYFILLGTRQPGNRIQLIFTGAGTAIHHDAGGAPDGYKSIFVYTEGTIVITQYYTVNLIYDGTYFRVVKGL
jgi:hypothetical protein